VTKQLGGQLGRYLRMDCRYPGYMRIRVDYPLDKPLMPQLMVKLKGHGQMSISLQYENVPHFHFSCGCIGHAAVNCQEPPSEEDAICYGEELRGSPPKRVKYISIQAGDGRVARPLFQVARATGRRHADAGDIGQNHNVDRRTIHPMQGYLVSLMK
jgi:hypothetical protein